MRQEPPDPLEDMERPSRRDQEIEQQQHEDHRRRARNGNRKYRRRQLDREPRDHCRQHKAHALRQSRVAPYPAINARHQERAATDQHDPRQAPPASRSNLRDAEIEIESQQHRAKVRRRHQRHIQDQLDEAALVAEAQDDARDRGQVLDLTGRLRVERSIHQEQRHQREEQHHERNQQHRVVTRHQAERDRATARNCLQANQRRRRARSSTCRAASADDANGRDRASRLDFPSPAASPSPSRCRAAEPSAPATASPAAPAENPRHGGWP